jgi:IS30 family transposase
MDQEKYNTKTRKWKQLSEKERYKIEALSVQGLTPAQIGAALTPKRDRRTIERELARGMTKQLDYELREKWVYLADVGQRKHDEKAANKGRGYKIGRDHKLAQHIEKKIGKEKYSPDAVIGEIREKGLSFQVTICTKTLYNYIDSGLFLSISNKDLPVKKDGKKRKYRQVRKVALNNTKGRSIEERPPEVNSRQEYGHWEMDCVVGSGKASLLVLTERKSRQELIFKIPAKTQKCVINVIDRLEKRYKAKFEEMFKSITMDNGGEFLDMLSIERSCQKPETKRTICYYAHPYSSWERGSNENQNKLIRRFIPKGSNIGKLSNKDIARIENWMNNYPRKIFSYKSANQMAA